MVMQIQTFFDKRTFTLTYVVFDPDSRDAVVIDPVLDYEPASSTTFTESADEVIRFVKDNQLTLHYILETHAHADHLSGSQRIKEHFPEAQLAIGSRITDVQKTFKQVFDLPDEFATDGRQFDRLLGDGETVQAGTLSWEVLFTPGHTPACASYKFGDAVFTGDALFLPDSGTGRCDFPAGSAHDLYHSVSERLYALPDDTRVFVGHDYQPGGREVRWESTIADQKQNNIQLRADTTEEQFVHFRNERDKTLNAPKLLFQSVQVNVDGGALPQPNDNAIRYLRIPLNVFKPEAPPKAERQIELRAV
jgi:glyoxylase-like metal-dependent hydrolase (beta-lactamase superfamily II)